MVSMAMNLLAADETLLPALRAGESRAAQALLPVFQRLETIIQNGYTDYALNCTYPEDNYDGSHPGLLCGQRSLLRLQCRVRQRHAEARVQVRGLQRRAL